MSFLTITTRPAAPAEQLPEVDLSTRLAGLELPNPILTASGCAAAGRELHQFVDVSTLGAVTTKSVMRDPRSGRPTPRMAETPSGMLNSIGLQGPGVDAFCEHDLPWLVEHGARTVVSIAGGSVDEYAEVAKRLADAEGVHGVEVNISCPNVESRGQVFACHAEPAAAVVGAVRRVVPDGIPVFAKLSPDVTDIVAIARACVDAGADGLSMINTLLGMVIDTRAMRPALAGTTGGLSGPAVRPVAVRAVWQVHAALPQVPIIGMGGVRSGEDVLELVLAGASAVALGTILFHDPTAPSRVLDELHRALVERGVARLSDLVGGAHAVGVPEPETQSVSVSDPENKSAGVPEGEPAAAPVPEGEPAAAPAPEGEPAAAPAPEGEPAAAPAPEGEPAGAPESAQENV